MKRIHACATIEVSTIISGEKMTNIFFSFELESMKDQKFIFEQVKIMEGSIHNFMKAQKEREKMRIVK